MYRLKLAGSDKPKVRNQTLDRFVLGQLRDRYGPGNFKKELKMLCDATLKVVEAPPPPGGEKGALQIFSWVLLFAQLVGFHSRSTRLVALPENASVYVRRAGRPLTNRGGAAAATRIVRGEESRRRRRG